MNIYHLPLVATLLSGFGACYAFVPRALNSKPHYSVPGSTSQLFASTDDQGKKKNVVIIGGGVAGLSIAHYLATSPDSNLEVTLLDREKTDLQPWESKSASLSAAGFLEPKLLISTDGTNELQSIFISIITESRKMYDAWVKRIGAGDEFKKQGYFIPEIEYTRLFPNSSAVAISGDDACNEEPSLNKEIASWMDFKNAATVDAQGLLRCLRTACNNEGVVTNFGEKYAVDSLTTNDDGDCTGVKLKDGAELLGTVVVANGADLNRLMGELNVVPVVPKECKCVVLKSEEQPFMNRAVLGVDAYILPKSDGTVLVGDPVGVPIGSVTNPEDDTPVDAQKYADTTELEVEQSFKAVRASTDDFYPILGTTNKCGNLYVAGGFNNYGLLIAPKAAELIGKLIINNGNEDGLEKEDKDFLKKSSPDRALTRGDNVNEGFIVLVGEDEGLNCSFILP